MCEIGIRRKTERLIPTAQAYSISAAEYGRGNQVALSLSSHVAALVEPSTDGHSASASASSTVTFILSLTGLSHCHPEKRCMSTLGAHI